MRSTPSVRILSSLTVERGSINVISVAEIIWTSKVSKNNNLPNQLKQKKKRSRRGLAKFHFWISKTPKVTWKSPVLGTTPLSMSKRKTAFILLIHFQANTELHERSLPNDTSAFSNRSRVLYELGWQTRRHTRLLKECRNHSKKNLFHFYFAASASILFISVRLLSARLYSVPALSAGYGSSFISANHAFKFEASPPPVLLIALKDFISLAALYNKRQIKVTIWRFASRSIHVRVRDATDKRNKSEKTRQKESEREDRLEMTNEDKRNEESKSHSGVGIVIACVVAVARFS